MSHLVAFKISGQSEFDKRSKADQEDKSIKLQVEGLLNRLHCSSATWQPWLNNDVSNWCHDDAIRCHGRLGGQRLLMLAKLSPQAARHMAANMGCYWTHAIHPRSQNIAWPFKWALMGVWTSHAPLYKPGSSHLISNCPHQIPFFYFLRGF